MDKLTFKNKIREWSKDCIGCDKISWEIEHEKNSDTIHIKAYLKYH